MKRIEKGLAHTFIVFILLFCLCNVKLLDEPFERYFSEETEFAAFKDEVKAKYDSDDFFLKNHFINLNGLFARVTGRFTVNEVIKLENGMLTDEYEPFDYHLEYISEKMTTFSRQVESLGIPFSYVQMPYKMDLAQKLLPKGTWNHGNENADNLLMMLEEGENRTFDLRNTFSATIEDIEKYFFITDHHWNFSAAFYGFQIMTPYIQELLGDDTDISMFLDEDNWTVHELPYPFLGTYGKRTGKYFAGFDHIEYFMPAFETQISFEVPGNAVQTGDFESVIISQTIIERSKDYLRYSPYSLYLGGHRALMRFRNENAPIQRKILLMGDSFMHPVQSFMSTVFAEIDVIDPRHYKESLLAYIAETKPEAVVMAMNPSTFIYMKRFNYGEESDL